MRALPFVLVPCLVACRADGPADVEATPRDVAEPAATDVSAPLQPPEPPTQPEPDPPPVFAELAPLPDHPGLTLGPALTASDAQRREALLMLLSDGSAAQLPVVATEPGRAFDDALVDELAPPPIVTRHVPIPSVTLRTPTVGPSYSAELVRRIVRAHINELRACYLDELEVAPQSTGKLVLRWTITEAGGTEKVSIASGDLGVDVASCVITAIETWKFPKPTHGALEVRYPLEFTRD